jgi:hypothetical protein
VLAAISTTVEERRFVPDISLAVADAARARRVRDGEEVRERAEEVETGEVRVLRIAWDSCFHELGDDAGVLTCGAVGEGIRPSSL